MDNNESSSLTAILLPLVATASVLLASSGIYCYWTKNSKSAGGRRRGTTNCGGNNDSSRSKSTAAAAAGELKNVWDAPRNLTSRQKTQHPSDKKPFGSNYYYAHNNPNAKGGYKDGLQMEDFTMNGPRLLSKSGNDAVAKTKGTTNAGGEEGTTRMTVKPTTAAAARTTVMESSCPPIVVRHIAKYLWDDPGDSNGVATIRIDSLPSIPNATELVDWKDAIIDKVEANLTGEGGLLVQAYSSQATYRLKIPKLYGDVASVRAVVKPKRLLIQLTKTKPPVFSRTKSNRNAWPQPHGKI